MKKATLKNCHVKLHGTTTVGSKGQIVIPSSVRKELNISPGDQLLVMVKLGKAIGLVKANELKELHKAIEKEMEEIKNMDDLKQAMEEEMQEIESTDEAIKNNDN